MCLTCEEVLESEKKKAYQQGYQDALNEKGLKISSVNHIPPSFESLPNYPHVIMLKKEKNL